MKTPITELDFALAAAKHEACYADEQRKRADLAESIAMQREDERNAERNRRIDMEIRADSAEAERDHWKQKYYAACKEIQKMQRDINFLVIELHDKEIPD